MCVFALLIMVMYLFLSAFRAVYWCSALYCLQIHSLFLTVCFCCFNSFVNHGTLVLMGSCFFLNGSWESNAFCMLLFTVPTNSLRSLMDNRSLMYTSYISLSWSNSHSLLTYIVLDSWAILYMGSSTTKSTAQWSNQNGPGEHLVTSSLDPNSVITKSKVLPALLVGKCVVWDLIPWWCLWNCLHSHQIFHSCWYWNHPGWAVCFCVMRCWGGLDWLWNTVNDRWLTRWFYTCLLVPWIWQLERN